MAGILLTQESGFADSLYGKSAAPIHMMMEQSLEAFEQRSALNKIFSMRSSKHYAEKMTALSALDDFSPTGENGAYTDSSFEEVFDQTLQHTTWKNRMSISAELIEDNNTGIMKTRAAKFTQSYGRTRERFGAALIAGATGTSIQFGGKTFKTTCSDGLPLFSTAHPNFYDVRDNVKNSKRAQSNLFAGEFSVSILDELEARMQNFVGDKDEILGLVPDTIIIPNDAKQKRDVFAAIGAEYDPNSSNNGFNFQYGRWNVIIWPYWQRKAGSTDKPFILMDSSFNDLDGTAVWFDRVPLKVKAFVDDKNDAGVYQGRARFSAGFNNWRGMLMGGVSTGTAL